MQKLKILVSAYACNPLATEESYPGEAILGWNLVKQLGRFHDVTVITRTYNREGIGAAVKKEGLTMLDFHYQSLPAFLKPIRKNILGFSFYYLLWQIKAYFLARRLHRECPFDVFHHVTFNNDWMPSFIGAYMPLPFIWGPMGGGQKVPGKMRRVMQVRDRVKESIRVNGQRFWRHTPFRARCVRRAKAILVCNKETRSKIRASDEKVFFFPVNGISPELIRSEQEGSENGLFRVIYAGRLDGIKGISMGIDAFEMLASVHPNSRFDIVGDGPEHDHLAGMVQTAGLEDKVIFTPWLEWEILMDRILASDVLIFPSMRDGGGAVIVEAMAAGKPVIGLDNGGPGFHIQKEWGIKIEPKDPAYVTEEMGKALIQLASDRTLRESMGRRAGRRAAESYVWDRLGDRLMEIYAGVLPQFRSR